MGVKLNGKLIVALRMADGLRQIDLLRLCESSKETVMSEKSLRAAEKGKSVGVDVYLRLARALRVSPADQLLAEKDLELSEVKRTLSDGDGEDKIRRATDPAAAITRVHLGLQERRLLRLFLLRAISPRSGFTLPRGSVLIHSEEILSWPQTAFEGFIAACLFFFRYPAKMAVDRFGENAHAALTSTWMGLHAKRLCDSGVVDDEDLHSDRTVEDDLDRYWDGCTLHPVGDYSVLIHEYCPACEPNSYYYGWLEFCRWITGNVAVAMEEDPDKSFHSYLEVSLLLITSYLNCFENATIPGREMFWLSTHMYLRFLRNELGSKLKKSDRLPLSKHSVEEMSEHLQRELEFNEEEQNRFDELIDSYEDRDTGYETALLKLQTMFIYTGKPFGDMIPIKAARHP